jgi:hypothetical protein
MTPPHRPAKDRPRPATPMPATPTPPTPTPPTRRAHDDDGFSTAELLANAAFAIVALFAIWQALQALGVDVISQIGAQLSGGL